VYLKVLNNNNTNKVTIITVQAGGIGKAMQWNLHRPAIKLWFNARDSDELNKARNDNVSATENSRFNISS
jgi:NADP-dependent 3-hydroxy acid dehydrogenase YdfG